MSRSFTPSLSRSVITLAALCAGLAAGIAQAASPADLERVTVHARRGAEPVYTNVRATCPGIEASLSESLGVTQAKQGREGMTTVTFRLSGTAIDDIRQIGGPLEYRTDIRRAVRRLTCQSSGTDKLYVMQLVFRNEVESDDPAMPQRSVALLGD